jgi:hypothetical protein
MDQFLGLTNEGSDLSCFLNTAFQVLYHMKIFNARLCEKRGENDENHKCIASVLSELLEKYENELKGKKEPMITFNLQLELVKVWGEKAFGMKQMADTMEVLNCLFLSIHHAFRGNCYSSQPFDDDDCECLVHSHIFMNFRNVLKCNDCGKQEENLTNLLINPFHTNPFAGDIVALKANENSEFPYTMQHLDQFPRYAKIQNESKIAGNCENCQNPRTLYQELIKSPRFLICQMIWKDNFFQKLKNLELFASLKFSLNIRELFETSLDENFNFIGFIINAPNHYYYIAWSCSTWWEVNDSKVEKIESFSNVMMKINRFRRKIVGVVFEKNCEPEYQIIDEHMLKSSEKSIIFDLSCKNCSEITEDKKCKNCGWSRAKSWTKWTCPNCLTNNKKDICIKCNEKRFFYQEKCFFCKNLKDHCICEQRFPFHCKSCTSELQIEKFCSNCASEIILKEFEYYCCTCRSRKSKDDMICFNCSVLYWTCLNCNIKTSNAIKCPQCNLKKHENIWYCKTCKIFNKKLKDCEKCLKPENEIEYCNICCSDKFPFCKCDIKIGCVLCSNGISGPNDLICFRCGDQVIDNFCNSCQDFIPKLFFPCRKCFDERSEELPLKLSLSKPDDCFVCRLKINDEIFLCWVCGKPFSGEFVCDCNPDKSVCQACLEELKYCSKCRKFFLGLYCNGCKSMKVDFLINELPYSQMFDSDWECFKCNSFNRQEVLFCEYCNHPQLSSFSETYKCKFCLTISPYPLCKDCLWINRCSNCSKKIFFTQSYSCGNCGSSLKNSFCPSCKIIIPKSRILCKTCTVNMSLCPCGRKKHPKSLLCKYCKLKITYQKIICTYCKNQKNLDICYYCTNEIIEEICGKCNRENSKKNNYFCGTCSLIHHKKRNENRETDFSYFDLD